MNKKQLALILILLSPLFINSQAAGTTSALDFLNSLPSNTQGMFGGDTSNQNPEQTSSLVVKENPDNDIYLNEEDQKFGFDFYDNLLYSTNAPLTDIPLMADYVISFGDKISLVMYGNRSRSITLTVSLNGTVNIPEVGEVMVNGLSITDAQAKINDIVSKALTGTIVDVNIKQSSFRKISIIGSVKQPGIYIINPYLSVIEALRYANGLSDNSSLRTIVIKKNNGSERSYDAYDYLVSGKNQNNISLENGDVILLKDTDKFVKIHGEVMRPKVYEYKEGETFEDLIDFAQGLSANANINNITATFQENGEIKSKKVQLLDQAPKNLIDLNISSQIVVDNRGIQVIGSSVSSGFYDQEKFKSLKDLISVLNFSPDTFPYFAFLDQVDNQNFLKERIAFSLSDMSTFENVNLKNNVKLTFLSRSDVEDLQFLVKYNEIEFASLNRLNQLEKQKEEILAAYFESSPDSFLSELDLELAEQQKDKYDQNPFEPPSTEYDEEQERKELLLQDLKNKVDTQTEFTSFFQKRLNEIELELSIAKNGFKELRKRKISDFDWSEEVIEYLERNSLFVNQGKDEFLFPLVGKFTPNDVIDYIGRDSTNFDYANSKILIKGIQDPIDDMEISLGFRLGAVFSIPLFLEENIQVKIMGNVKSPGEYLVPINSTLQDLYIIAGGLGESADDRSIFFSRESLKEKEKIALQAAKKVLIDSIISRSTSSTGGSSNLGSLLPLIEISEKTQPVGRISGDLTFDSETSKSLILENGDTVQVPSKSMVVNILGQVLTPATVVYDPRLSYKDYVNLSGGFNYYADKRNVYVIQSNGLSKPLNNSMFRSGSYEILPGDTIVVPRDFSRAELLGNLGIATKVISDISLAAASLNVISSN